MDKSRKENMSTMQTNDLMTSIDRFVKEASQGTNVAINLANTINPEAEKEINKQLKTLKNDIQEMCIGKMSYAEIRARYG